MLRRTLPVAAALFGALAWLGPAHAVLPAIGAQLTGMASLQPGFRRGVGLPLATAIGLFFAAFVGNAVAPWPALFIVVLGIWAFGAALFWTFGQAAGMSAAMTLPVMLTITRPPQNFTDAVQFACEIGAGGAVTVLTLVLWPGRSWAAERAALADACASVADYALRLRDDPVVRFDPTALARARDASTLTPRQARQRPAQLFGIRALVDEARAVLAAVADGLDGEDVTDSERESVRTLLTTAAEVLNRAASSIRTGTVQPPSIELLRAMNQAAQEERLGDVAMRAANQLIELISEIDSILRQTEEGESTVEAQRRRVLRRPAVRDRLMSDGRTYLAALRGNSPVLRHAVRVAIVVAVTDAICKAFNVQHGYWAALTVMMVSRPDFSQTFSRGIARLAGTYVGVFVPTAVMVLFHPGPYVCAVLATLCVGALCTLIRMGYLVSSTLITAYIVFLLSMVGSPIGSTVEERVALTTLGGALTLITYAVWPSWQTVTLASRFADLMEAVGDFAAAAIDAVAEPGATAQRQLREALLDSRDNYLRLESTVLAASTEPVRDRGPDRTTLANAHDAVGRVFRAAIVLQTHLPEADGPATPAAAVFATALRRTYRHTAEAVRERKPLANEGSELADALAAWIGAAEGTPDYILRDARRLAAETHRLRRKLGSLGDASTVRPSSDAPAES